MERVSTNDISLRKIYHFSRELFSKILHAQPFVAASGCNIRAGARSVVARRSFRLVLLVFVWALYGPRQLGILVSKPSWTENPT
jgi:hypothetical protein